MNNRNLPFWLITIGSIVLLTLSVLVQDGMFMDATLYTSVAHNESLGIGNFWFPQYSTLNIAGLTSFHEQPPLVFGIVSLFFRVFGDSMYVERLYTFITLCITMLLMWSLWKEISKDNPTNKRYVWLSYILWISIPCIYWAYSNNMCENTMGLFALCSVVVSYRALRSQSRSTWPWMLSGLFIFMATFSKGIPGFFPISVPLLYYIFVQREKLSRSILQTIILTAIPLIVYAVLFSIPVSKESLSMYLFQRAFHRIGNDPTVKYHVDILYRIFCQVIPPLIIMLIIAVVGWKQKIITTLRPVNKQAFFFIAVGLSASAPLALTLVQKDIYLIPCFPYLAIGMTLLVLPPVVRWIEAMDLKKKGYKILLGFSVAFFVFSLGFMGWRVGQVNREQDMLHDVYLIGKTVPKFSTMTVAPGIYDEYDFVLEGFLVRYDNISISPLKQYEYLLVEKGMDFTPPAYYKLVNIPTVKYDLYKK